jgi:glycosyltransferase involved in cell wall biosynthesis
MKISIIIPVFNNSFLTGQCLKDLSQLDENHEIIVVDNGSTDDTANTVLKSRLAKYINNGSNLGFAKASNIGYAASSGDIVIFLNNDIRVKTGFEKTWTNLFVEAINSVGENDFIFGATAGYLDNQFNFVKELDGSADNDMTYISGWCLAATRKTFEKFRTEEYCPFIEEFGTYFEDTYMGFEARRLGIGMRTMNIPVVHLKRMTSRLMVLPEMYTKARNKFIKKVTGVG